MSSGWEMTREPWQECGRPYVHLLISHQNPRLLSGSRNLSWNYHRFYLCLLTNLHLWADSYRIYSYFVSDDTDVCQILLLGENKKPQNVSSPFFYFSHSQVVSGIAYSLSFGRVSRLRITQPSCYLEQINISLRQWSETPHVPDDKKHHWFCSDCIDA